MLAHQRNLFALRRSPALILVFSLMVPLVVMSQESGAGTNEAATTTPEVIPAPEPGAATSTATTTTVVVDPDTDAIETPGAVLGITTEGVVASDEELSEEEEETNEEESPEEVEIVEYRPPPPPPLKTRKFERKIAIDRKAAHSCEAETFRIDVSGKVLAQARIRLGGKKVQSGELEIGSLPLGIDILFSDNGDYRHGILQKDGAFDLEIVNQEGSQKGSFSIPIFYTDRESNQITICQINVTNF